MDSYLDIHWIHWTCPFNIGNGLDRMDPLNTVGKLYRWTSCPMDTMVNGHDVQWTQWIQWILCPMDTMPNAHNVQWTRCLMDPMDAMDISNGVQWNQWTKWIHWTQWIHWTKTANWCSLAKHRKWIQWIKWIHWIHWTPLDNFTDGHHVQWTPCSMDTMFNGHDVQWAQWIQWTLCPMDTISNGHNVQWTRCPTDPMDTMDPLDKNKNKLMFTRQTKLGDYVHWIHSDVSIGHPLDPLEMSIEHRKWIQWKYWFPLNTIGQLYRWTYSLDMMDPFD